MDSATDRVLDVQDFRRRCAAHHQWLTADPDAVAFIEQWAESNLKALRSIADRTGATVWPVPGSPDDGR